MLRLGEDVRASDAVVPKIPSFLEDSEEIHFPYLAKQQIPRAKNGPRGNDSV